MIGWHIPAPEGMSIMASPQDTTDTALIVFEWFEHGAIDSHPVRIQRSIDGSSASGIRRAGAVTSAPAGRGPIEWEVIPDDEMEALVQLACRHVDALTLPELLDIARRLTTASVSASTRLIAQLAPRLERAHQRVREAELTEAALAIEDPGVRSVAVQLRSSWKGTRAGLVAAAEVVAESPSV